ncbi:YdbL family protein [Pseudoalteromonas 'SMAR']|uniref:YdbL family protein n=1 Tax=Pseudoalteromonas 'SMAR' TaxID=3416908 RepID=UPI003AF277E7
MQLKSLMSLLAGVAMSFAALAMSLDSAKSQGLVGETMSGYLGVVKASPEVQQLVDEVNAKRKEKYQQLAKQNGITLAQVEALAAKKAYTKTQAGHYIQVNGRWVKK